MPANIILNQATLGAGTAGLSRTDGVTGQVVTCSNATVESSYAWTLIDTPIRSGLARGTLVVSPTFQFTPDVKGTYLVRLQVNNSTAPGDTQEVFIGVASSGTWTLGWRYEAAQETLQDNTSYPGLGFPGDVNPRGWATNRDLQFEQTEEAAARVLTSVITSPGAGTDHLVRLDPLTGRLDASVIPGAGGGPASSLQDAYSGGSTIGLTDAQGDIALNDTAQTSGTNMITAVKTFAGGGNILDLRVAATAQGNAIRIEQQNFTNNQAGIYFDMDTVASGAPAIEINDTANVDRMSLTTAGISFGGENLGFALTGETASAETSARDFAITGGAGGTSLGVAAAGNGSAVAITTGAGGAGAGVHAPGAGGAVTITTGDGGAGTASVAGGAGGTLSLVAGAAGTDGGAGAGTDGTVSGSVHVAGVPTEVLRLTTTGAGVQTLINRNAVANPGLSFLENPAVGFSLVNADADLAFVTAGTQQWTLSGADFIATGNGRLLFDIGTSALPGLAFDGDEDTGFYRDAVNRLGIAAGGAESVVIGTTFLRPAVSVGTGSRDLGLTGFYWRNIWAGSAEGGTTSGPGLDGYSLTEVGTNAGAYSIGVDSSLLSQTSATATDLMTTLDELDAVVAAGGTATLQTAYNNGRAITINASQPIDLTTAGVGENAIALSDGTNSSLIRAGQYLADNGSTTEPGISFISQPSTGFMRGAVTTMSAVVQGERAMRWASTGPDGGGVDTATEILFDASAQNTDGDGWQGLYINITPPTIDPAIPGNRYFITTRSGGAEKFIVDDDGFVRASDGATNTPSYTFIGDTTTGISGGTGLMNFVVSGAREAFMQGTHFSPGTDGGLNLGLSTVGWGTIYGRQSGGTVGNPTFTWASDTDTGFYKPGADIVAATAGGSEVVRWDGSGTPTTLFSGNASPIVTSSHFLGTSSLRWNRGYIETAYVESGTAAAPAVRWRLAATGIFFSSGLMGVTVSGSTALHVRSTLNGPNSAFYNLDATATVDLAEAAGAYYGFRQRITETNTDSTAQDYLIWQSVDGTPYFRIRSRGEWEGPSAVANTGDEVIFDMLGEVNKLTSGNYAGIRLDITETSAPGTDNRLLDLQVGGVSQMYVENTGHVLGPTGNATNPTFSFTTDTDTGMYLTTVGRIGWSTGGINRLTLRSTEMYPNGAIDLGRSANPWANFYVQDSMVYGGDGGGFTIQGIDETTAGTTAETLFINGGDGAAGSGAGTNAGDGGPFWFTGGTGGAGSSTDLAGAGGYFAITGGTGGAGTASVAAGNGGGFSFIGGAPGTNGGGGEGVGGGYTMTGRSDSSLVLSVPSTGPTGQTLEVGCSFGFGDPGPTVSSLVLFTGIAPTPLNPGDIIITSDENVVITNTTAGKYIQFYPETAAAETGRFDSAGLKVADGTVTNPSLAFLSDPDTGFYYSTNTIRFSIAGTQELYLNANELSPLADAGLSLGTTVTGWSRIFLGSTGGSVGSPAITRVGATDTGIYWANADRLAISASGQQVARFQATASTDPQFVLTSGTASLPAMAFDASGDTTTGLFRPVDGWDGTAIGVSISGDEVARFENDNAWDDGNLQITKDLIDPTAAEQVWQGGSTDVTTAATNATSGDWTIFPTGTLGDLAYIGMDLPFEALVFDNAGGTAGAGALAVWEYWNGSTWTALTVLSDETNGLTAAASDGQALTFIEPPDWATTSVNSVTKYYIRARVTQASYSTPPVYDQLWVVGQQTAALVTVPDASTITSGNYSRVDGYKMRVYGVPGGTAKFRPLIVEYLNQPVVSIQDRDAGGFGIYMGDGGGPAYGFLENGFVNQNIGMGADVGNQHLKFYVEVGGSEVEQVRIQDDQVLGPDGTASVPGYSFLSDANDGMSRVSATVLALTMGGESVELDSANSAWAPDVDNTLSLGFSGRRWSDVFAAATTIGDLIMHDLDEGPDSPFLILRESHETIEVFDVQANKKFVIPLQEVPLTSEDQARIDAARAKLYGENN